VLICVQILTLERGFSQIALLRDESPLPVEEIIRSEWPEQRLKQAEERAERRRRKASPNLRRVHGLRF
jgi:hypothetical protein